MKSNLVVVALTLMICSSGMVTAEENEAFEAYNGFPDMESGDYFSFKLDTTGLIDWMKTDDIKMIRQNGNSTLELEYAGSSCLQTELTNCHVLLRNFGWNMTMIFSEGSNVDDDRITTLVKTESIDIFNETAFVQTITTTTEMWYAIDGVNYHDEIVETEVIFSDMHSPEPDFIKIGDTWTTSEKVRQITNEKSRTNGGDWTHEEETTQYENITTNYNSEIKATVFVGNQAFETIKIRSQEAGENDYTYTYVSKNGIPVKLEDYSNNTLLTIATLSDYQWTHEPVEQSDETKQSPTEDPTLPFVNFPLTLVFVGLAAFLRNMNTNS